MVDRDTPWPAGTPCWVDLLTGDLGTLIKLPGGAPAFAAGAEYRKEESRFDPDAAVAGKLTYASALTATAGAFDVKEVFGELSAPLLADLPLAHRLVVGGAVRLSDYSTAGRTASWKTDGSYSPLRGLSFNATYSTAVRAPNISELYAGNSQVFGLIPDPCNSDQLHNGTPYRAANCRALLTSLGVADPATYNNSRVVPIVGTSGGNPNLSAETAKTWTAGVLLQPQAPSGLSVRADWYDINLRNAINTVTFQDVANLCVDSPTLANPYCAAITRQNGSGVGAQAGNITSFALSPQNVSHFRTAGLDLTFGYAFAPARLGQFNIQLVGNYRERLEFVALPTGSVINRLGEMYAPKYSANGDLTWSMGPFTLNYGVQWFDRTLRDTNQALQSNPEEFAPAYTYIKAMWQHNVYVALKSKSGLEFFGGVNNLLDAQPDFAMTNYPVSPVGRYLYAGVRLKMPTL